MRTLIVVNGDYVAGQHMCPASLLTLPLKRGVRRRWPGVCCPRPGHGLCPPSADRWQCCRPATPQARDFHSQQQTISIILASPGAIVETALHRVTHMVCMWLSDPFHLGRGEYVHASVR